MEHIKVGLTMRSMGGDFIAGIGQALCHADNINVDKIKKTWPEEYEKYLKMSKNIPGIGDPVINMADLF